MNVVDLILKSIVANSFLFWKMFQRVHVLVIHYKDLNWEEEAKSCCK